MNIHPLFVHFPIALLMIYSLLEIARLKFVTKQAHYDAIKFFLLITGTLAAVVTAATGELAEEIMKSSHPELHQLIETHSGFAGATITIFGILAFAYTVRAAAGHNFCSRVTNHALIQKLSSFILTMAPLLAVIGLVAISITGGLGAAIVYGPEVDPMVTFIYNLFF